MKIETKQFQIKDAVILDGINAPHGGIRGYGSTFGNFDRVKEAVVPGAFKDTLANTLVDGFFAAGHDWKSEPDGYFVELKEDSLGLYFEAHFHSTQSAQDLRTVINERIAAGKSVKLSIGYEVLEDEYVTEGRLLKRLNVFEISFVTVPANNMANVTDAKSMTFADELEAARAAVNSANSVLERATGIQGLRVKAGRTMSAANVSTITELWKQLDDLADSFAAFIETLTGTNPDIAEDADENAGGKDFDDLATQTLKIQSRIIHNKARSLL